jgi:hypothetical protein
VFRTIRVKLQEKIKRSTCGGGGGGGGGGV